MLIFTSISYWKCHSSVSHGQKPLYICIMTLPFYFPSGYLNNNNFDVVQTHLYFCSTFKHATKSASQKTRETRNDSNRWEVKVAMQSRVCLLQVKRQNTMKDLYFTFKNTESQTSHQAMTGGLGLRAMKQVENISVVVSDLHLPLLSKSMKQMSEYHIVHHG